MSCFPQVTFLGVQGERADIENRLIFHWPMTTQFKHEPSLYIKYWFTVCNADFEDWGKGGSQLFQADLQVLFNARISGQKQIVAAQARKRRAMP